MHSVSKMQNFLNVTRKIDLFLMCAVQTSDTRIKLVPVFKHFICRKKALGALLKRVGEQ
jgi:hypothetical protein